MSMGLVGNVGDEMLVRNQRTAMIMIVTVVVMMMVMITVTVEASF